MSGADDATLVAQAKAGDREAFGELVRRHGPAVNAIARAYFASEADAEDAAQEALVKAYRSLDQLYFPNRFAAWVARITKNTCLNTLASRTDKVSLEAFASTIQLKPRLGQIQLTPSSLASKGEEAEQLRAAIGRLPEPQRLVLMLRYIEDMTHGQMADYLDIPASTVHGRLQSARRELRRMLGSLRFEED